MLHQQFFYRINIFKIMKKKVQFELIARVQNLIVYDFAYRQSRRGKWEEVARDRIRFQHRIYLLGLKISEILETKHRNKVFNERSF